MDKVRVDQWLWSVRIFKSRTLATTMCKSGKVSVGKVNVKPSYKLRVGDLVNVHKNGYNFQFLVLKLLKKRVGAPIAVTAYRDQTPAEELSKYEDWFVGKSRSEFREPGSGRPTKKDRRELDQFKGEYYFDE
ncbi:MAG: RNA-binding S4 domain-containing protein [Saprospiraceae bacterium]|nr:RNA-binding S4 domain-containing protein [Saprospiraceae bacterium]